MARTQKVATWIIPQRKCVYMYMYLMEQTILRTVILYMYMYMTYDPIRTKMKRQLLITIIEIPYKLDVY